MPRMPQIFNVKIIGMEIRGGTGLLTWLFLAGQKVDSFVYDLGGPLILDSLLDSQPKEE